MGVVLKIETTIGAKACTTDEIYDAWLTRLRETQPELVKQVESEGPTASKEELLCKIFSRGTGEPVIGFRPAGPDLTTLPGVSRDATE